MYTFEDFFEDIARHIAAILGYSIGILVILQMWSVARIFLDLGENLCTQPNQTVSAYTVTHNPL